MGIPDAENEAQRRLTKNKIETAGKGDVTSFARVMIVQGKNTAAKKHEVEKKRKHDFKYSSLNRGQNVNPPIQESFHPTKCFHHQIE